MKLVIGKTKEEIGKASSKQTAALINAAIAKQGYARILLSTGASQFPFFDEIVKENVDWSKVEMFHLDEYVNLPETHIASFRKYLKERFINIVHPKEAYLVDGNNPEESIKFLTEKITESPVDLGLIGIGENAHIAFNDPPADFNTRESYFVVNLDEKCRMQQVGEGWFAGIEDVPAQAISMTPYRIMQCKTIISVVPHTVKAWAVKSTIESKETTPMIPATLLKEHADWYLFVDENSGKDI